MSAPPPSPGPVPRRRSSAARPERFFASGVVDPATDLETVAQQVIWLRDRARMVQHDLDTVQYRQHTTLCRAALAAIAIAQLVLACLPWWVFDDSGDGDTAGPWSLGGILSNDPTVLVLVLAVLPLLAYVGGVVMIVVSLAAGSLRTARFAVALSAVAALAAMCQLSAIGVLDDSDDVSATAASLTALLLWVSASVLSVRVASDTD